MADKGEPATEEKVIAETAKQEAMEVETSQEFPKKFFFFMFVLFRCGGAFFVRTAFVPDEYWQSLEVAHKFVFGYGYQTWEWKYAIRSSVYPMFISAQYYLLKMFKIDTVFTVTMVPRLVQAFMSAIGDYWTVELGRRLFGYEGACWTAVSLLCSWFLHYTASRTLTNVAEQVFTAGALSMYPWGGQKQPSTSWSYLWLVGLSCMIRPTALVLWLPLVALHFARASHSRTFLLKRLAFTSLICFGALMLCDRWFYQRWVCTPWNFVRLNLVADIGAHYGKHPWHWYFTVGLPAVLALQLLPFVLGVRVGRCRLLAAVVIWHMLVLSLVSHKEFRFLLPVFPLAMCVCGAGMARLPRSWGITLAILLGVAFFPPALYFGLFHQKGTLEAMDYLSKELDKQPGGGSVTFLMPCHSTPFYSHIHRSNVKMKFLTCEPNIKKKKNHKDEARDFFLDPVNGLKMYGLGGMTDYVVIYNSLYKHMIDFVVDFDLKFLKGFLHTHFPTAYVGKEVWIYKTH